MVNAGGPHHRAPSREEILLASCQVAKNLREVRLSVPGIHCGGCLRTVEQALARLDTVAEARANLTSRSVIVRWRDGVPPPAMIEALAAVGHAAHLGEAPRADKIQAELVRSLAIAGFATSNIMLFSVSVWAGAGDGIRAVFHAASALIALPVLVYSGRTFYRSAWSAVRHGRTNMDVPISIGLTLAFAMSLYDTLQGGQHAYFDAVVMLLFFLLIGRTLDHAMRARARRAVGDLARLAARGAMMEGPDGTHTYLPAEEIRPGMTILLAAGERVPVDARVLSGTSDLDRSLVTGESAPQATAPGMAVEAGTLNLTAPLRLQARSAASESFLAEMTRMMTAAEAGHSRYKLVADRAAALYAPLVHSAALLAFLGWAFASGDIHRAAEIAVSVLIITCPCALGLAVPIVQVVAARRMFEHGVMVRDGAGLERLADVDTVVFDKTGTLTSGEPQLRQPSATHLGLAAALAAHSRHPYARALVAARHGPAPIVTDVRELPGRGIEGRCGSDVIRLGRSDWVLDAPRHIQEIASSSCTTLSRNGACLAHFHFDDRLRPGAGAAIRALTEQGCATAILSGDHIVAVADIAARLGVTQFEAGLLPADKVTRLQMLAAAGRKTLMVGDGLNDAPALAAACVSMAPSDAADVGRQAADFVFLRASLEAIPFTLSVARRARTLIRQNFALAILYNAIALPFAVAGLVTPLAAALAMSVSSLAVVANALRLNSGRAGKSGRQGRMLRRRTPVVQFAE
ncbi:MAG: cadmium-translocating P-type ATPase [Alphaproteobacteria bacterium]|nr:cadmium-translocating P-type ATPase [Alphaproteobacteria bacterium]